MISSIGLLMSLNDPQWGNRGNDNSGGNNGGKRPNQGPPDLEELWRDLNRRLSGLFDKKGGSGGNGGNGGGGGGCYAPSGKFTAGTGGAAIVLIYA